MLDNFNILSSNPEARRIFPEPPLVSYRRERNVGDILVHSANASPFPHDAGSFPYQRPRCKTCRHMTSQTFLQGPKSAHNICDHFACQSESIVYCISCGSIGRVFLLSHMVKISIYARSCVNNMTCAVLF